MFFDQGDKMSEHTLLPCPFCGGEAGLRNTLAERKASSPTSAYVMCKSCLASTSSFEGSTCVSKAISAWNRRASPPAAVPDVSKTVKQRAWEIADQLWLDTNEKRKLARLICDAFSDSPTPPVDDGWRPIETAPRDGTVIDVWLGRAEPEDVEFYCGPGNTRRAASWHWHKGKFRPAMGLEDAVPPVFVQPTHWRPLPPPPGESE